jgi:hypothetical protein
MKVAWVMNKEPFLLIKSERMVYSFFKYLPLSCQITVNGKADFNLTGWFPK